MKKLTIVPTSSSYSVTDGQEVVSTQLDGGAPRLQLNVQGAWSTVNVTWTTNKFGFKYLRAFYRAITASGSLPFLVDLVLDDYELTEHVAKFQPNSLRFPTQNGQTYSVSATLFVEPKPLTGGEVDYVDFFNDFGHVPVTPENALNTLLNDTLPDDMP